MVNAEPVKVRPDHVHHGGGRLLADIRQPVHLRRIEPFPPDLRGHGFADRDQIFAPVFERIRVNILAERLTVTRMDGTGQPVDLPAGVVDIIFPRDIISRPVEQVGDRIADHSTSAVTHVHRSRRIGGNIFHVDIRAGSDIAAAIFVARLQYGLQQPGPESVGQTDIDETWPGNLDGDDVIVVLERSPSP